MLELRQLSTGYGETRIVQGIDLMVEAGSVHALLGRNGAGKSTTLKAIVGLLPLNGGSIRLKNEVISGKPAHEIARLGIAYVPETRDIFASLSVRENLLLAGRLAGNTPWTLQKVVDFFPHLRRRLDHGGHELSGGEQQMLAIGRALMTGSGMLVLDEPTEGLAPIVIQQIFKKLRELKETGLTILLVEQNLRFALGMADRISVMGRGRLVWHGDAEMLRRDKASQARWLGV